jgi:cytochrome b pre-mRNA-processing protein 3
MQVMSPWNPFRRRATMEAAARQLYAAIVAQARQPAFYESGGVPDSVDGRFEMIALHGYLVLRRLRGGGAEAEALAQALVDTLFADLDASLREMGAGDLGVPRRIKRMATGFFGRVAAYDAGLVTGSAGKLGEALRRNVFGTVSPAPAQVEAAEAYLRRCLTRLQDQPLAEILAGRPAFAGPSETGPA